MADSRDRSLPTDSAAHVRPRSGASIASLLGALAVGVALLGRPGAAGSAAPLRTEDPPGAPTGGDRASSWNITGSVRAIAQTGNTIYFGGDFSIHDTHAGCGVALDAGSATISSSFPVVGGINSIVYAAADDGAGGWYIGGDFSSVGGLPRSRLAHVLADGTVAPWNPGAGDYEVRALAVAGDVVYVGGNFRAIGGQTRVGLAAIDARTGEVLPWNPGLDGRVGALAISGHTLYVGGWFSTFLGQSRSNVAAVDTRSGAVTDWNPVCDGYVSCLAIHGDVVYAGGDFLSMGGVRRGFIAAVDASTGATTAWDAAVAPSRWDPDFGWATVSGIAVTDGAVYVGGYFYGIGGATRTSVAALDPATGTALRWNPVFSGGFYSWIPIVFAIGVSGPNVFIGGGFFGGDRYTYPNFMVTDTLRGDLRPWNTAADLGVTVVAPGHDQVLVGGAFRKFEQTRRCLASLDARTGRLDPWNSGFVGERVNALAARDSLLYVGGRFTRVAGGGDGGLAEIDTRTRAVRRYLGSTDGEVRSLLVSGSRLYVGGAFSHLYGFPFIFPAPEHRGLGAVDLDANLRVGVVSDWDPQADGEVDALAITDSALVVGGRFGQIGGEPRPSIAAIDAASGAATPWNPTADGPVGTLAVSDGVVFAGGDFGSIGGAARHGLAALDARTGLATPWSADVDGPVEALLKWRDVLYVGGAFQHLGGQPRSALAAVLARSGAVLPWAPAPNGDVRALAAWGQALYAGGAFTSVSGASSAGLVALGPATGRPVRSAAAAAIGGDTGPTLACVPGLARSAVAIRFSIPASDVVTIELFDLAGRRMASPLDRQIVAAGAREVSIPTATWAPGCYFCRLKVGAATLSRRFVVVR